MLWSQYSSIWCGDGNPSSLQRDIEFMWNPSKCYFRGFSGVPSLHKVIFFSKGGFVGSLSLGEPQVARKIWWPDNFPGKKGRLYTVYGAVALRFGLFQANNLLSQWLNFKFIGITYLVGKIKFKLFFFRVHWLSEIKNQHNLWIFVEYLGSNQPPPSNSGKWRFYRVPD